jgi:uncharacterized membrane protein YdbT with pleckstrin-like domain
MSRGVTLRAVDIEPGEVIFFHGHPSWRSMTSLYVKGLLVSLLAGVVAGVAGRIIDHHVQTAWVIAAVVVVFVAAAATGQLRRIATTYSITDRRLTIETGLLSRDLHQTRLERIQNVNARQSMFERALGIGTVDFDTAGEARFDFAFIGVGEPRRIVRTVDGALHALRGERPVPASDV